LCSGGENNVRQNDELEMIVDHAESMVLERHFTQME